MSAPFEVRLDAPWVESGGRISGHVLFLDDHAQLARLNQVEIHCRARIHGSGSTELVSAGGPQIYAGPVQVPLKVPFAFTVPREGPVSYAGRYVKIDWAITVKLDVSWAIDPKQDAPFRVVPRGGI
jgi:hypothetical protein